MIENLHFRSRTSHDGVVPRAPFADDRIVLVLLRSTLPEKALFTGYPPHQPKSLLAHYYANNRLAIGSNLSPLVDLRLVISRCLATRPKILTGTPASVTGRRTGFLTGQAFLGSALTPPSHAMPCLPCHGKLRSKSKRISTLRSSIISHRQGYERSWSESPNASSVPQLSTNLQPMKSQKARSGTTSRYGIIQHQSTQATSNTISSRRFAATNQTSGSWVARHYSIYFIRPLTNLPRLSSAVMTLALEQDSPLSWDALMVPSMAPCRPKLRLFPREWCMWG